MLVNTINIYLFSFFSQHYFIYFFTFVFWPWNARLDELEAEIKIAGRNMNNLRYVDDTTLMAESREEPKNLLMRVKEESEKSSLKVNIKKN